MEKHLGYRRIQRTGRGSYIISLPKNWVQRTGLEKGSEVAFRVQEDSSMILIPRRITERNKEVDESELREFWVYVDEKDEFKSVRRKIISLYAVSADVIHIRFTNDKIAASYKRAISNLVKNILLGSEITDETNNEITVKILIRHHEFPVEKAIRRMSILALSAIRDAIVALKVADQGSTSSVIDAHDDVDRLNLYVIRQLKYGLEQNLFRELGFKTPKESLGYRIVVNDIKSIADNAVNIANSVTNFKKLVDDEMLFLRETIDEELYSQILEFNSAAHQLFDDSLKAMFKRDYEHADGTISRLEAFATRGNDLIAVMSGKRLDPNVSSIFSLIIDNSRRIIEYSRNIAEVTLNRTIEEVSSQRF